ncbi:hypothetical protein TSUD_117510 [Trifolium subterraneum]|nr:hypothetical protein TSUD_117510 [Trifolium subterraneum]
MDIDLRLPSGEHDKEEEETTTLDNMLEGEEKLHNGGIDGRHMVDAGIEVHALNGGDLNSPTVDMMMFKEDTNLEPLSGMEFESHGEAYSFYQEYARSMGFNTAIQNSRRSKTSREFIDANKSPPEAGTSGAHGQHSIEEDTQSRNMGKSNKKKNPTKKKKVNSEAEVMTVGALDNLQQMDKFSTRTAVLEGYYGAQQSVQGMLNLMGPTRDDYYGNQQTLQGLGPINSIPTSHDGYYGAHQSMPGLAQLDFLRTGFTYGIRQDDPNVRAAQLHEDPSRHA